MKVLALVLVALLAAACDALSAADNPKVFACKVAAEKLSGAPSTIKYVNVIDHSKATFIEFDAANMFGVPMRHTIECTYVSEIVNSMSAIMLDGRNVPRDTVQILNGLVAAREFDEKRS